MASGFCYDELTRKEVVRLAGDVSFVHAARTTGIARTTIQCWAAAGRRKRRSQLKRVAKRQSGTVEVSIEEPMLPVASLREAVQRCQEPRGALCHRLGWSGHDTSKLARALGEMPNQQNKVATTISEDLALKILNAIHLDPVDIGI